MILISSGMPMPAHASGLQSVDISGLIPNAPESWSKANDDQKAQFKSEEDRFTQSPTLKALLERTEASVWLVTACSAAVCGDRALASTVARKS